MTGFLHEVNADGTVTAEDKNPADSLSLLKEILHWRAECCTDKDIIAHLRPRTVPTGYQYTSWNPGMLWIWNLPTRRDTLCFVHAGQSETDADKLHFILAQLEYQYLIGDWEAQGVPFKSQLYVPEVHPVTGTLFCEREDEGHVLKVLTCACTCNSYIVSVRVQYSLLFDIQLTSVYTDLIFSA